MAVLKHRLVPIDELVGLLVTYGDGGLKCEETRIHFRRVPNVWETFLHVGLSKAERKEGDVPVGTGAKTLDHVIMDEPREWAAIVEGDGKSTGHGEVNLRVPQGIPRIVKFVQRN